MTSPFADNPLSSKKSPIIWLTVFAASSLALIGLLSLIFIINSLQHVFPNQSTLGNIDVSLLTKELAVAKITEQLPKDKGFKIALLTSEAQLATDSSQIDFEFLIDQSVENAFTASHANLSLFKPYQLIQTLLQKQNYPLSKQVNQEKLQQFIVSFAELVDNKGHQPFATLAKNNQAASLSIDPGKEGLEINQPEVLADLKQLLEEKNDLTDINLSSNPMQTHYQLNAEEEKAAQVLAEKYIRTYVQLKNNDHKDVYLELEPKDLVSLLAFPTGLNQEKLDKLYTIFNDRVKRPSQDAIFKYQQLENGTYQVDEFQPHQAGLEINRDKFNNKIEELIKQISTQNSTEVVTNTTLDLDLDVVAPAITLEKTNDLGIKELIGFGDSYYAHSIPNRIWNVALTAKKINYTLIPPGKEFSFNKNLGEVSRATGYRPAYVISGGKTVLGDGGGVCQVSTTVFRAALSAGLDITKRKAHAYRVSYYELNKKPGIDATVYSGDVDLRFINDTPGYILMTTYANSDDLYMNVQFYGTNDGRTAEILNHKTWDERPALAPVYYPTTELPPGKTQQIDWAVSGIKASFDYLVKDKDGNVLHEENFYSNYVPWSAKYLQGI